VTFPCCPYDAPCPEHQARRAARLQAEHGLPQLPPETGPGTGHGQHPEPVPVAEVIQAFRDHPELFTAGALPEPPEAA
jgi:hypothetical protein